MDVHGRSWGDGGDETGSPLKWKRERAEGWTVGG